MKVTWGTHPNNIGHEDFLGCFRCHDENHKAADGRTITQDCDACHTILADGGVQPQGPRRPGPAVGVACLAGGSALGRSFWARR